LTWHEWDHAEGKLFYDEDEALEAYENVNASFAKRLYDPSKMQVDEYGSMGGFEWCELETWAYGAQCNGEAPAASSTEQTARSNNPGPRGIEKQKRSYAPRNHQAYPKQTRSGIPPGLKKQARSNIPIPSDRHDNSKQGKHRNKKSGDTPDSFSQNSQNKDVDEMDKVVSDGSFIYAAYGDVLYALPTDGEMKEASITLMPGEAKECDWNTTEPCTTVTKPNIEALFLGKDNSRLTVVVSSNIYEYLTPTDQNPPLITDYGTQLEVRVYDVSEVTPGSPLNELGHKALSGSLFDGVSVGDKIVIATSSLLDTYELTKGISRSELQYCGLNTTSYKEVATSTAESKIDLLASQIVDELDLLNECSKIVPLSMMMDASDPDDVDVPGLTGVDFLQGSFIQIFSLDVSSDFDADEAIQSSVAGSFRAGWGYSFYLSDGFLALLSDIYKFNYTTGESTYESFILGFDISSEKDVAPVYYGHLPGLMGGKYRMEKSGDHLKILSTETYSVDPEIWSPNYLTKIFTLGIPSTPGRMPLLDKSEDLLDKKYETTAITFSGDKIYLVADDWNYENKKRFVVVDMVDQMNPNVVSSLEIDSFVSYLHEININGSPYILCVGTFTNTSTWESSTALTLIDVSTPLDPKKAAFYKEEPGVYSGIYDFLAVRYLEDSNKLILPFSSTNYTDHPATFTVGFQVYDISASAISSAFNVVHSTNEHYCYYEAMLPPRSFVIQSELITFKEHSAVKSNVDTGSFISKLDLDVGFNYSVCDEWYYYDYAYSYEYIDDDAINSTEV
jgi:DNA excision repair protein ERCC-4